MEQKIVLFWYLKICCLLLCSFNFAEARTATKKPIINLFAQPFKNLAGEKTTEPVLELGLFVTSDLEEAFHEKFKAELTGGDIFQSTLLTNYLKGLNDIFSSPTYGKLPLRIVVTRLEIVRESTWRTWENLWSFCTYQSNYTDIDTAILIVRHRGEVAKRMNVNALGQTYRAGVCTRFWRCGLVQENELLYSASRRLIAHEVAHSLGLTDQGFLLKRKLLRSKLALKMAEDHKEPYDDLSCLEAKEGLMTSWGENWLPCSVKALHKVLKSEETSCLYRKSGDVVKPDGTFVGLVKFIDRKSMCKLYLNVTSWLPGTELVYDDSAGKPLCRFGPDECKGTYRLAGNRIRVTTVSGQSWPTGTMCSNYVYDKLCYHGECLPYDDLIGRVDKFIRLQP